MTGLDLIGVGECMVECYSDQPLSTTTTFTRSYGGDVLNTLVMGSRLGLKTGFITRVGNDPFGPGLLQRWQEEGIDTRHAPLVEGENGIYFISLQAGGEREFTYRRAGSAASGIQPEHLDEGYFRSSKMLLVSGISQAISESARRTVLEAVKLAKAAGVQVAYDPNFRPRLWASQGGEKAAQEAFFEVLPYTNVLLPSFPADLDFLDLHHQTQREALAALAGLHPLVVLKSGEEGAFLADQGHITHVPAQRVERVVDTTGAGDCWNGAFLAHHLQGAPLLDAISFAHRAAASKLAFRGAIAPRDIFSDLNQRVLEENL